MRCLWRCADLISINYLYYITNLLYLQYYITIKMELRVKELCREKGLKMSDLANRMCMDQANLTASLKGNPTLARLTDVAKNLGVEVYELFHEKKESERIDGFVELEGETVRIRNVADWMQATCRIISLPYYSKVSDMRKAVHDFVHRCVRDMELQSSLFGCVLGAETFNISFHSEDIEGVENGVFILTCFGSNDTIKLELLEYGCDGKYDLDSDEGLIRELCNCIERPFESCESAAE